MNGIVGFCDFQENLFGEEYLWAALVRRMGAAGENPAVTCITEHAALGAFGNGSRILRGFGSCRGTACLCGRPERKPVPRFPRDRENPLFRAYEQYGPFCAEVLRGDFVCVLADESRNCVFLCCGESADLPLYYLTLGGRLIYATEKGSLFEYPGVSAAGKEEGFCRIFNSPPDCRSEGVLAKIGLLSPGKSALFSPSGLRFLSN